MDTHPPPHEARFEALRACRLFGNVDEDVLLDLARGGRFALADDGEPVLERPADRTRAREHARAGSGMFHVVVAGAADVLVPDADDPLAWHATGSLVPGDWCGDATLLSNVPAGARVVAAGGAPLVTVQLDAHDLLDAVSRQLAAFRLERRAVGGPSTGLPELSIFGDLPLHSLGRVLRDSVEQHFPIGTPIVVQGDDGDRFHIVVEGQVDVDIDGSSVATLAAGDFFGELALIHDAPRAATVRAVRPTITWSIGSAIFGELVRHTLLGATPPASTIRSRLRPTG